MVLLYGCLLCARPTLAQEPVGERLAAIPVVFNGRTLFAVYSPLAAYQPEDRARIIANRLQRLADNAAFRSEALHAEDRGDRWEILAEDLAVATVTEGDEKGAGRPRSELARRYTRILRLSIETYRRERNLRSVLVGLLLSFGVTVLLIASLFLLAYIERFVIRYLNAERQRMALEAEQAHSRGFFQDYFADILLQAVRLLRLAADALLLFLYLITLLGLFPWTRSAAVTLLSYTQHHLQFLGTAALSKLPDLIFIGVILLIANGLLRLIHLIFDGVERRVFVMGGLAPELAAPTYRIVRILVIALTGVAIFPYIPGSNSLAFQGISVFVGALLTLGSSSIVSNLIAGIVLTYMRPFRVGDRVRIGERVGDVIEKTDLVTRLRTPKNEEITLPNMLVLGTETRNYSSMAHGQGLILHTSVTIGYDVPWRRVHALLLAAAVGTEPLLKEPAPFVLQTALNDFFVTYEINAYTDLPHAMNSIYSELHQNIQDQFNAAGVEIMSPHYNSLRDGSAVTIPQNDGL